jgi:putative membrane protein
MKEVPMSTIVRSDKTTTLLWAATALVMLMAGAAMVPGVGTVLLVLQVAFVLLHGAHRYGWRAIGVYVLASLVISNILENLSIATGFPFGDYHYTGGGKIFEVPWLIGPSYLATGYLAWVVATVLLGEVGRTSPWLTTIGTPVIAAFAMTAWDLALDPGAATINHFWIWENGGGFFGVPLQNFLGWTFTVYLFMQVFALYLQRRGPLPRTGLDRATASDLQAVLLYAATTIRFYAAFFSGERTTVTDAVGMVWRTGDIYETGVVVTIYGMSLLALLALLRIAQRQSTPPTPKTRAVTVIQQAQADPTMRVRVMP